MKGWGTIALVVAGLYWLQAVLIPIALAVLLTFLLSPVVGALQRRGLGRVPSVLVTVVLALSVLGGVGWTLPGARDRGAARSRFARPRRVDQLPR